MEPKQIELIVSPEATPAHFVGDGFKVHNFIPSIPQLSMKRMSPFIMLDYNATTYFPPADRPRGVDVHPHRGFETVTIAYKGKIAHHDSTGNSGVIGEGDVQWMTAASGILHKEYHEKEFSKNGGDFQMVQLWVNLPANDKMSPPKYQALSNKDITKVQLAGNAGAVDVIAGAYDGIKGSASTFTPVNVYNARLNEGGTASFSFPSSYNTALLVVEGSIKVNKTDLIPPDHFVLFENKGDSFTLEATEKAVVLILGGEPINEPIATYGPFVMNTHQELTEAIQDFNSGKFGYLDNES